MCMGPHPDPVHVENADEPTWSPSRKKSQGRGKIRGGTGGVTLLLWSLYRDRRR